MLPFLKILNIMSDEKKSRVETYMLMLDDLSKDEKLELIVRLSKSLRSKRKRTPKNPVISIDDLYGAWKDEKSAEDLIAEIRQSRVFTRQIEPL